MAGTKKKSQNVLSTKVFVGYLPETVKRREITELFEVYGEVVECDIVKDFAFVHFKKIEEAKKAVKALDGTNFKDCQLHVQISISRVRTRAGMGDVNGCYSCGSADHWSRNCPNKKDREEYDDPHDRRLLPPPPPDYYRDRDRYLDYYPPPRRPYSPPPRVPVLPPEWRKYSENKDPYLRPPPEYYRHKALAGRDIYERPPVDYRPLPPV